jgi:hypothetical protein
MYAINQNYKYFFSIYFASFLLIILITKKTSVDKKIIIGITKDELAAKDSFSNEKIG